MEEEERMKLSELACKLSSMTFVLKGCCESYEGELIDSANLIEFVKILHEISNELFILL